MRTLLFAICLIVCAVSVVHLTAAIRVLRHGLLVAARIVEIRRKRLCNEWVCRYEYQPVFLVSLPKRRSVMFAGSWSESRPRSGAQVTLLVDPSQSEAATVWSVWVWLEPALVGVAGALCLIGILLSN